MLVDHLTFLSLSFSSIKQGDRTGSVFYKMLVPGYSNLGPGHQCFQKAPGVIELRAVLLILDCVYKLLRIVLKSDSISAGLQWCLILSISNVQVMLMLLVH